MKIKDEFMRWNHMPKCPKCGAEVDKPIKTWVLAPKGRKGVVIGLYKCPNGHYFRAKAE